MHQKHLTKEIVLTAGSRLPMKRRCTFINSRTLLLTFAMRKLTLEGGSPVALFQVATIFKLRDLHTGNRRAMKKVPNTLRGFIPFQLSLLKSPMYSLNLVSTVVKSLRPLKSWSITLVRSVRNPLPLN